MHWIHSEVELVQDIKDWQNNLTDKEKYFLTNIFRFFTQSDIDVAGGYVNNYLPILKQPELRMMLLGFAAREAVHIAAYSHLIETLGMQDSTYSEFLQYEEMKNKKSATQDEAVAEEKKILGMPKKTAYIVIGSVAGMIIIALILFFVLKKK